MKIKSFFLVATLFWSVASSAQVIMKQDTTGNLTWVVKTDNTLTISGSGAMPDYEHLVYAPWYPYRSLINTVVIGDSVTSIGKYAFHGYSNLTSVTIGNSVTTIGHFAFYDCSGLTSVTLPNSVTTIGAFTFSCSGLISISIPNSVTSIGMQTFSATNLTSITIPDSVKIIEKFTFRNCCRLASVIIPNSVTTIENDAFDNCNLLDSVILPHSLITIGRRAFHCTALSSISIPKNVTTIEEYAFALCTDLQFIIVQATTPPPLEGPIFERVPISIPVYIPCGTYEAYSTAWRWAWSNYGTPVEFSNYIEPTIDTGFYSATFRQGETYSDANFTNLMAEGKYYDTIQRIDGCDSIVCLTLTYDQTGIKQLTMHNAQLIIYPNPTTAQLRITNYQLRDAVDYSIYSITGQKIIQGKLQDETTVVNVETLAKGMYYLRVAEKTVKFIKE